MDERASFETRAVLGPRRARLTRLALLLPALALVAITWAGASGGRSGEATAEGSGAAAVAAASANVEGSAPPASRVPRPQLPAQVLGMDVRRLDEVEHRRLGRDEVVALAGWYVATAITDCPRLAALYRDGALPNVRGDADVLAFCERSGVLYASRSDVRQAVTAPSPETPTTSPEPGRSRGPGPSEVSVTLVVGVVVPLELETVGGEATEVVVVGRFVDSDGCGATIRRCPRELVVDHVAWTSGP